MNKANHRMVQLARESRGYTQTELAEKMDIPQGNLSRMEDENIGIKKEHLLSLSKILDYPLDFFFFDGHICTTDTHYRKRVTIDQKTKLRAEAIMNIYKFNIESMLKSLDVPNKIPVIKDGYESPIKMAQYLRSYWKIPKGPIDNLAKIIEESGIIIIVVDFETDKIDGRTIITDTGHPVIFLNSNVPGDRERLTLAHELAHVILHVNSAPSFGVNQEEDAFAFAHEFLMPLAECEYDLTEKLSLEKLADLKRIWKISMAAILYRAKIQKLISANRYRYLWSQVIGKGWKIVEPIPIPNEQPSLKNRMVGLFIHNLGYTKPELAKLFRLNLPELEIRYFRPQGKLRVA